MIYWVCLDNLKISWSPTIIPTSSISLCNRIHCNVSKDDGVHILGTAVCVLCLCDIIPNIYIFFNLLTWKGWDVKLVKMLWWEVMFISWFALHFFHAEAACTFSTLLHPPLEAWVIHTNHKASLTRGFECSQSCTLAGISMRDNGEGGYWFLFVHVQISPKQTATLQHKS